jgi:hypothetical protein
MLRKVLTGLALASALLLATAAQASARDRNHDRIPDRWEKHHRLSLKVKQGRRDQDHDGLRNRAEFRAHMDPRDDDTDGDGIEDGDENAGTISAFSDGMLTIDLFGGGEVTGAVTGATEVECEGAGDGGEDRGDDDSGDDGPGGDHGGDLARASRDGDDDSCALTVGAVVHEAELDVTAGGAVWHEIELR